MLTPYQEKLIRIAVGQAADKNAEIKKLSVGMKVSEADILASLGEAGGISNTTQTDDAAQNAAAQRAKRIIWTDEMLQELCQLRDQGLQPHAIAAKMGLDRVQVVNKLARMPGKYNTGGVVEKAAPPPPVLSEPETEPPCAAPEPVSVSSPATDAPPKPEEPPVLPRLLNMLINIVQNQFSDTITCIHADSDDAYVTFISNDNTFDLILKKGVSTRETA